MATFFIGKKFQDVVSDVDILAPQVHIIITGAKGPVQTQRSLALITVGNRIITPTPIFQIWGQAFLEEHNYMIMRVDFAITHRWKTCKF